MSVVLLLQEEREEEEGKKGRKEGRKEGRKSEAHETVRGKTRSQGFYY